MAIKTTLFAALFAASCIGALYAPIWGVLGYVANYSTGPQRQWWERPLAPLQIRYSLTLAAFTAVGMLINWDKLRFGQSLLYRQEKLVLLFLGIMWAMEPFAEDTWGHYNVAGLDLPEIKHTKIVIFLLMLTHVVTDLKNLNRLIWVLILGATIVGHQAWSRPYSAYVGGRLEGIGGPDFADSNVFAACMAMMLWIIGTQFLRSGWTGKVVCFVAGGFTTNAMILTRSRGAVVGLAVGALAAVLTAPRRYRPYMAVGLVLAGAGFVYLTDAQFRVRASTITASAEERDNSAQARITLAKGAIKMWLDHPLGVGVGNFYQNIPKYIPVAGRPDAHNTYLRCLTELGIQGFVVLGMLIFGAFAEIRNFSRRTENLPALANEGTALIAWGLTCATVTMLACGLFISITYAEFFWWYLVLPVCLRRVADNLEADVGVDSPLDADVENEAPETEGVDSREEL